MIDLTSLSLRSRFLIAPAIGIILTLIIFFKSHVLINDHTELLADLHNTELPRLAETTRAMILLSQHNHKLHELIIETDSETSEEDIYIKGRKFLSEHQELEAYFNLWTYDSSHYVSNYAPKDEIDFLMGQVKTSLGLYSGQVTAAIDFIASRSMYKDGEKRDNYHLDNASEIMKDLNNIFLTLSGLHTLKLKERSLVLEEAKAGQTMTTAFSFLLMFLMLLSAIFFSQHLSKTIEVINRSIVALAKGDKNIKFPVAKSQDLKQLVHALSVFQDVLIKKEEQKHQLTLSQERYYNLLNISATAIITVDQSLAIVLFNRAAERIYGFMSHEVLGKPISILIPDAEKSHYQRRLTAFAKSKVDFSHSEAEVTRNAIRKNGEVFPVEMRLGKTKDDDAMLITISMTDVTERVRTEQKMRHQAHYDSLTGLPNRLLSLRRLREYMKDANETGGMTGVMFLDLDDFKKINDSMGHEAGDLLLIEAAKRLREVLNRKGSVGRLGGDEFIVLLEQLASVEKAQEIAAELVMRFREPFEVYGRELVLTSSIGVSFYPQDASTSSELLKNADTAMYQSKKLGRNTYSLFTRDMSDDVSRRLLLEEQMRGGLGRGEFSLNYQPKVDLRTNRVSAVEALIRWDNAELGSVSPDEFISIAEQSGLIIELGQFVIATAISSMQEWAESGFEIGVAINLSPRQFHDPNLVSFITEAVQASKIKPALLELEITEGVLMSGHRFITEALKTLNELGVKLAMDDFGTGFSSLSYLREYSFDTLKIDRSFIADLMNDEEDRALVNAIIAMAHSLGLEVVAEGVETVEQLDYLKREGCEYAQGFLKGRPMLFNELTQALVDEKETIFSSSVA